METTPPRPIPVDQPGLHLLVGRPATGKTTSAIRIVAEACSIGREVRFLSLEAPGLHGLPEGVVDDRGGRSLSEVLDALRALPRGGLLVVDYLQLLHFQGGGMRADLILEGLAALKEAAGECGVTVVVTAQLHRDFETPELRHSLPKWCAVADSAVRIDRDDSGVQAVG
jgi:replicative DNA helicase